MKPASSFGGCLTSRFHAPGVRQVRRALAIGLFAVIAANAPAAKLYVAVNGDDTNPGTHIKPFATLARARDEIRELKLRARRGERVMVVIRGGMYRVTQTLRLSAEDSGNEQFPVIWQAAPRETVRFLGAARLTGFKPVSDPAVRARLDPVAREHVVQLDLKSASVVDFGPVTAAGGREAELVCDSQYMTLARYPNPGNWLRVAAIPEGGTRHEYEKVVHFGRFTYDDERPARWKDTSELWVHGYWVYDWSDQYHHVQMLDLQKKEVWPGPPYHVYGYKKGQRFYFLNVLEELDQPGE